MKITAPPPRKIITIVVNSPRDTTCTAVAVAMVFAGQGSLMEPNPLQEFRDYPSPSLVATQIYKNQYIVLFTHS